MNTLRDEPEALWSVKENPHEELFRSHRRIWQQAGQIERERRHYSSLFNLAPIGFLVLDEDGKILEANLVSVLLLVVPSPNIPGQDFGRFICHSDQERFSAYRKASIGKRDSIELEMCSAFGRRFNARAIYRSGRLPGRAPK